MAYLNRGKQASALDLLTSIDIRLYIHTLLTNNCINIDAELYYNIEAGSLYDEEDNPKEIFQYFVISKFDGEYLASKTDMPLFYSEKMDLHLIGIDFLDNWENISFDV